MTRPESLIETAAEQLGRAVGLGVTDGSFGNTSLDVTRARIADYDRLARAA